MSKKNSRRQERNVAFQVLYGMSFAQIKTLDDVRVAFCQFPHKEQAQDSVAKTDTIPKANVQAGVEDLPPMLPQGFAWELVLGVWKKSEDLNAIIKRFSRNWRVDRMGRVELTILQLALFEMLFRDDIPPKVAINEAVELSRQFGEESARSFVNGILDATAKALEAGEIEKSLA